MKAAASPCINRAEQGPAMGCLGEEGGGRRGEGRRQAGGWAARAARREEAATRHGPLLGKPGMQQKGCWGGSGREKRVASGEAHSLLPRQLHLGGCRVGLDGSVHVASP